MVVATVVVGWRVGTEVLYPTTRDTGTAALGRGIDRPGRRVYRALLRTGVRTDGPDSDGLTGR